MDRRTIVCAAAVGLITGMARAQPTGAPLKQNTHIGWIESEAHPVPGTPPATIQADIAAGKGYVFIDDSTNKAVKANVMSPAAILPHAGEHVGIVGINLPANGTTQFYIVQVALDQKAVDQRTQQIVEAQAKAKTEQEADAKLKADAEARSKIPEFGPETTYQGWYVRPNPVGRMYFVEEGTNKSWIIEDENALLYYRKGQHMVITARLRTTYMNSSSHPGVDTYIRLHLDSLVSIMKDQSKPPASAVPAY